MSKPLTIYSYPNNYRVQKAQIAAAYVGVEIKEPGFRFGTDNETPEFLKKNPNGKVPVLETPHGFIWESNAIARYVAGLRPDRGLLGDTYYDSALVAQWVDWSANELENPRAVWIYPIHGYMQFNQQLHDEAVKDTTTALTILNDHLLNHTFLVGNRVTLADITILTALVELFTQVLAPSFVAKFPNVLRWWTQCTSFPEFQQVLGKPVLNPKETKQGAPAKAADAKPEAKPEERKASEKAADRKQSEKAGEKAAERKKSEKGEPAKEKPAKASKSSEKDKEKKPEPTNPEIEAQAAKVRSLKAANAPKDEVQEAVALLLALKEKAKAAEGAAPVAVHTQAKEEKPKEEKPKDAPKKEQAKPAAKAKEAPKEAAKEPKAKDAPKDAKPAAAAEPKKDGGLDEKVVKAALKEGGKKGQDLAGMSAFGSHFFCVSIESADGNMKLLELVLEGMNAKEDPEAEERKGGAGELGKILFNCNDEKLIILCHTPPEVTAQAKAAEWMEPVLKATGATVVKATENIIEAELLNNPDKDIFVLKKKDEGLSAGFNFLRSRSLMVDDDEDDENYAVAAGINLNAAPGQVDY